MKSKRIPQAEFGFTSETFNLGQQSAPVAATGLKIVAEMTADERAQFEAKRNAEDRAEVEAFQAGFKGGFDPVLTPRVQAKLGKSYAVIDGELHSLGVMGRPISDANQTESEAAAMAEARQPGLAPGSYWSVQAMRKAIATGGGR